MPRRAAPRRVALRGYLYGCPSCGGFQISSRALTSCKDIPACARDDVRLLRSYGHQPQIEVSQEGVPVVAGRS
jgi:hypothetical protein